MSVFTNVALAKSVAFQISGNVAQYGAPGNVNDGDANTYHSIRADGPNRSGSATWTIDFGGPQFIWSIAVTNSGASYCSGNRSATVQYTPDGTTWNSLGGLSVGAKAKQTFTLGGVAVRGVRVSASVSYANVLCGGIYGFQQVFIFEIEALAFKPGLYFVDGDGTPIDVKDFGSVVAGDQLGPISIQLRNLSAIQVATPSVTTKELPAGDTIELSKYADPFIPEDPLVFSGTFGHGGYIGTVYVRMRPPITSPGGQKSFRLRARATPV